MTEKEKSPIKVLRDRRGGMSPELKEYVKEQNRVRKLIAGALKGGPRTIPQIADEAGIESPVAVWHVMAMKKYGKVSESGHSGDYLLYELKEGS